MAQDPGYRRPAWLEVDLGAVASNVAALRALLPPGVAFMAVVKADGYGHGVLEVSRTAVAAGADRLGVALLEEGELLRERGLDVPIQILGETPPAAARRAVAAGLEVTTGRAEMVEALSGAGRALGREAWLHLKVDTGMRRIGCEPADALDLARRAVGAEGLVLAGVMTHFATSECPDSAVFLEQVEVFGEVRRAFADAGLRPRTWHAANSAATILSPQTHQDMVRCGIAVYGLHPGDATRDRVELVPALGLIARVSHVKRVQAGQGVSYGHTWIAERPTVIATIPVGYADGYARRLSNLGHVVFEGHALPVVGNVTMDQILVAVPDRLGLGVGDAVTVLGKGVSADDLARLIGTINYEVVCMLGRRLPRYYTEAAPGGAPSDEQRG